jgi:hypothetical protein
MTSPLAKYMATATTHSVHPHFCFRYRFSVMAAAAIAMEPLAVCQFQVTQSDSDRFLVTPVVNHDMAERCVMLI